MSRSTRPACAGGRGRSGRCWAIAIHTDWQDWAEEETLEDWDLAHRLSRYREWGNEWNGLYGYGPALWISAQVQVCKQGISPTSIECILKRRSGVIGDLNPGLVLGSIVIDVEIRALVESMMDGLGSRLCEIGMDVREAGTSPFLSE